MRRSFLLLCLCFVLTLPAGAFAATADDVTLTGSFVWVRDDGQDTGDLTAVFTPAEQEGWSVAFHFTWDGEDHVYLGTAEGNLETGTLRGTARSDDEERKLSFRFEGEFDNGTFNGSHGWIKDDGTLARGGTLTLAR